MSYPKKVYKSLEDRRRVFSLEEEVAAAEDGYISYTVLCGKNADGSLVCDNKPEPAKIEIPVVVKKPKRVVIHKYSKPVKKVSKKRVNPIDKYKKETGKRAYAFGNETKAYKAWLKEQ